MISMPAYKLHHNSKKVETSHNPSCVAKRHHPEAKTSSFNSPNIVSRCFKRVAVHLGTRTRHLPNVLARPLRNDGSGSDASCHGTKNKKEQAWEIWRSPKRDCQVFINMLRSNSYILKLQAFWSFCVKTCSVNMKHWTSKNALGCFGTTDNGHVWNLLIWHTTSGLPAGLFRLYFFRTAALFSL